jgi:hypothetical protein
MALSDKLSDLAARTKQLEDRAAAAKQTGKSELEAEVKSARESAQAGGDALRQRAESSQGEVSVWWDNVQRSWNDHLNTIRKSAEDKRAAHDLEEAQRAARRADDDADFAIDYAYAAIEEAEYAVLEAELAHKEADELAGS